MMVVLRKRDCEDCQKMFVKTFKNQSYIKQINESFICIVVSYEEKNNYPIEMFYTLDFPALFFVNNKDESFITKPVFGFVTPAQMLDIMKNNFSF